MKKAPPVYLVAAMLAVLVPFTAGKEGLSLVPYRDLGGVWTQCYGETEGVNQFSVKLSEYQCRVKLKAKLTKIGMQVWWLVKTDMSPNRWAALNDFVYNLGIGAFQKSTLLKKLNEGDPKACDQILRFKYVAGKDCSIRSNGCYGIIIRREEQVKLCYS